MEQCVNHSQYDAVEHCEHCHVPLCGLCLWYVESGERLCDRCAKQWEQTGTVVYEPKQFVDGIQATLAQSVSKSEQPGLYTGNRVDLGAFAAACLGAIVLISCVPCVNVLTPVLGLLVGVVTLSEARRAVDPKRTRMLAWVGIGGGGLVILVTLGWLALALGMPLFLLLIERATSTP